MNGVVVLGAIVQQPNDARFESMLRSALEQVDVDYILPATEIGTLLIKLAARETRGERNVEPELRKRVGTEPRGITKA